MMIQPIMEFEEKSRTTNVYNNPKVTNKSKVIGVTVCKYWLEGRCKKGENCEYLHENNKDKLPECQHGINCSRQGCPFKHTRALKECVYYKNGFCKEGKSCKLAHKNDNVCLNYLIGFCPDGPNCKFYHLKSMINPHQDNMSFLSKPANH